MLKNALLRATLFIAIGVAALLIASASEPSAKAVEASAKAPPSTP